MYLSSVIEDPISVIMPLGTLENVSKNSITLEHSGKHFPLFLHDRRCNETCLTTSQKREVKRKKKDQPSVCRLDPVNNSSPGYDWLFSVSTPLLNLSLPRCFAVNAWTISVIIVASVGSWVPWPSKSTFYDVISKYRIHKNTIHPGSGSTYKWK